MAQTSIWSALWPDPDRVLRALGIQPGMTVLEFCCGDGYFTVPLTELVGENLFVFDVDPEALERTRAKVTRSGGSVRGWIWADAEDLATVVPETVDAVFMANVLNGVSDKPALAKAFWSAIKPNGLLAMIEWHQLPRERTTVHGRRCGPATEIRVSPDEARTVIEAAGFVLSGASELPPYHYGAIFRKIDPKRQ